jgi:hypothetical protein
MRQTKQQKRITSRFHKDKVVALRSLDLKKIKQYMRKWRMQKVPDEQIWIVVHKARVSMAEFTLQEKLLSRQWLIERGYSTSIFTTPIQNRFIVEWFDLQVQATEPANPEFPDGIKIDVSLGAMLTCNIGLKYPAPGVGRYHIACRECGRTAAITTAGRADDPKSVRFPCMVQPQPITGAESDGSNNGQAGANGAGA